MARVRSPNYPQLSLPEAVERTKKIHAAEQHLAAPKEVIARHLGYNGLNGASNSIISALGKYGLLEEVNGNRVKVSPLALSILYPSSADEKAGAIYKAAYTPALFQEINDEWGGARPSDENLRAYLIRKNFAADALDRVIQSYRETMDLVTRESAGYIPANDPKEREQEKPAMQTGHQALGGARLTPPPPSTPMRVSFNGDLLEVSAVLADADAVDRLVKALEANKALLPKTPPKG